MDYSDAVNQLHKQLYELDLDDDKYKIKIERKRRL